MIETYKKIGDNILRITRTNNDIYISEENRTEIQTQIDHLEFDKIELQKKIDELKNKIAILDKED